jgi:hypothetical protein
MRRSALAVRRRSGAAKTAFSEVPGLQRIIKRCCAAPGTHVSPSRLSHAGNLLSSRRHLEINMAQESDTVPVAHHTHDGHFDNVCLTGGVIGAALFVGLAGTAIIFWWALFAHH